MDFTFREEYQMRYSSVRHFLFACLRLGCLAAWVAGLTLGMTPAPVAHAANFTVNNSADVVDAAPGNGVCETATGNRVCTLRAAIQEANALPGNDTITLPPGLYVLTRSSGDNAANRGDLDITSDLTLIGAGADTTVVDGNLLDRVFHVFSATVQISGVTIQHGNSGSLSGGGLRNAGGTLTLADSAVVNNSAGVSGGGIYNTGVLTLTHSSVLSNTAEVAGGGIRTAGGTVGLVNVTVSGNTAKTDGGGIRTSSAGSNTGTLLLRNVTVTNNTADHDGNGTGEGGGLYRGGGVVMLQNTLVADNFDNSAGTKHPDCSGTLISQGYNLVGNNSGCNLSPITGDLIGIPSNPIDPLLGPLQNNGGPTLTHALHPGSPAIDSGSPATPGTGGGACEATDQRNVSRPQGPVCDIGAYETSALTVQFSADNFSVGEAVSAATITATLSVASNGTITVNYVTSNGTALAGTDYVAATGTLTFTAGSTTAAFTVPILDDALDEPDETVILTLSNPVNAALGAPNPATLTILDDDEYGLVLAPASDGKAGAPGTTVAYTLTLTNTGNVTDTYSVSVSGAVFTTTATPSSVGPLAANAATTFVVSVQIPANATGGTTDVATITARSQGDSSQSATATLTTTVVVVPVTGGYPYYLPLIMTNP